MTTFADMQQRKKISGLLALWFVLAVAVVLVWLLHEQKKVASVYILPVDGEMMTKDWGGFRVFIDSIQPFAILLEPDTLGQQPEFGRLVGVELSSKIKATYPSQFRSITPDSLFQKAFAISIRKAVDKLDESAYQSLIDWESKTAQVRAIALMSKRDQRDSLLQEIHSGREKILGPQFVRIPSRYAGLLMRNLNQLLHEYPNQSWVILVDIEKFNWLKDRLVNDQRIAVINEADF